MTATPLHIDKGGQLYILDHVTADRAVYRPLYCGGNGCDRVEALFPRHAEIDATNEMSAVMLPPEPEAPRVETPEPGT